MEYSRTLDLPSLTRKKSIFLFGARGTGKSTLVRQSFPSAKYFDLLDADVYGDLLKRPKLLAEETEPSDLIILDEVQKLPQVLDEVHRLIESRRQRFVLTGSSARKLKRGGANLLAGRAWTAQLRPLTVAEIPDFSLSRYLNNGGLPGVHGNDEDARENLKSYVNTYLKEEIQAEALTRNVPAFARFLDAIAFTNGEELNFESLASDSGVKSRTVINYVDILTDTLLAFTLSPFTKTQKRKAITRQKLYLFDVGVTNALCRRGIIEERSELWGRAFEHFIACELRAYLDYTRHDAPLCYWRSTSQFEVDFVVGDEVAIECKSTNLVTDKHCKGLRALKEERLLKHYIVVSDDPRPRRMEDKILVLPWREFLSRLHQNDWLG